MNGPLHIVRVAIVLDSVMLITRVFWHFLGLKNSVKLGFSVQVVTNVQLIALQRLVRIVLSSIINNMKKTTTLYVFPITSTTIRTVYLRTDIALAMLSKYYYCKPIIIHNPIDYFLTVIGIKDQVSDQ